MLQILLSILHKLSYVVIGLSLALFLYSAYIEIDTAFYMNQPIENIFISSVVVPDFKVGDNPIVQYERTIKHTFVGDFHVEVKSADDGITICSGNGIDIRYEKGELLNKNITSFDWYVGNKCSLSPLLLPGQYYLETNYLISMEGFPNRYLTTKSNVFTVSVS